MLNEIIHGDCLEVMKQIPDKHVDLVLTDPPYFLPATHYNVRSGSFKSLSDLSILEHYFFDVFKECRRILKDTGFLYSFCDGQSYPVFYATAFQFFKKIRPLVWDKCTSINGYSWRHQHELIAFAECSESPAIPTGDGDVIKLRAVPIKEREHLAQKPVELYQKIIEKHGKAGLLCDPFCGSGTAAIAAIESGWDYVCIERDINYQTKAEERAKAHRLTNAWRLTGKPVHANCLTATSPC